MCNPNVIMLSPRMTSTSTLAEVHSLISERRIEEAKRLIDKDHSLMTKKDESGRWEITVEWEILIGWYYCRRISSISLDCIRIPKAGKCDMMSLISNQLRIKILIDILNQYFWLQYRNALRGRLRTPAARRIGHYGKDTIEKMFWPFLVVTCVVIVSWVRYPADWAIAYDFVLIWLLKAIILL